MRIFELPLPLCPTARPAVAALIPRPNKLTISHSVYIAQNEDASSYAFVVSHQFFSQQGILSADYGADTFTIDENRGATIELTGIDTSIDEQTLFAALSNKLLCIIDDEIMSVISAEVVDVATFRLGLVRGRFTTERAAHTTGAEVHLIALENLLAIEHPFLVPGNTVTFKITAAAPDEADTLEDVDPIEQALTGRALNLPAPTLLTINGQSRNASYRELENIEISWQMPPADGIDIRRLFTYLEFLEADVVVHTEKIAFPTSSLSYDYPAVRPETFVLRASMLAELDWETIQGPTVEMSAFHAEYV